MGLVTTCVDKIVLQERFTAGTKHAHVALQMR